jgi:hypothetical protein
MPLTPTDWNAVVIGRWNRALLTPQYIVRELFEEPAETEVRIEFPIDAVGPFRLSHKGLVVVVAGDRLIVEATANDADCLDRARVIALRAVEDLGKTPLAVAGYNLRYRGSREDQALIALTDDTELRGRKRLADAACKVKGQNVTWIADWNGVKIALNLMRQEDDPALGTNINFECGEGNYEYERRAENRSSIQKWLSEPASAVVTQARKLLTEVLGVPPESVP